MKHEYRFTEPHSFQCADNATSRDSDADSSSAEARDTHREHVDDTAWDNWKSVRDVA